MALGRALVMIVLRCPDLAGTGDLNRGIALLREVIGVGGPPGSVSESVAEALAVALIYKYKATGEPALVEEANGLLGGRLHPGVTLSEETTTFPEALTLGGFLLAQYQATGQEALLDAALATMRSGAISAEAGNAGAQDRAGAAELFSSLGVALRHRYLRNRERSDVDAAVMAGRRAVDLSTGDDLACAGWLTNLANTYRVRYEKRR